MHVLVHGHAGVPILVFPCQDSMCDNFENFGMVDLLSDYIESGQIQLFSVDTVDRESWSDVWGDKGHRAWIQECYYHYIVDEVVPLIHEVSDSDQRPIATGCSLGATHAAIVFFRRPDLFEGVLAMSGSYDAPSFWDGWCDENLYNNSPMHFLENMPTDHPYINLYNQRKIILCVGQGQWESDGIRTTRAMKDIFERKGIHGWVDLWGYDVDHDWPWWKKQIRYFLPYLLN
jgi:esterase/lipase superfamily enzyme